MTQQQIIHGTDYIKAGLEKTFSFTPTRAAAITPGKKQSLRRKHDANEDCLAWIPTPEGELFLAADSHYGSLASKHCVDHFTGLFQEGEGRVTRRLMRAHFQLDDAVRTTKHSPGQESQRRCSTTLVSALVKDGKLHYCNTGDSRLWLIRQGSLRDLIGNEDAPPLFVGDDVVHLFQYVPRLEKMDCIDIVTERPEIIEVLLRLHEIHHLVKTDGSSEDVQTLVQEVEDFTAMPFPITLENLMESWHDLHLQLPLTLPQTGSFVLREGDVLMLATDGIDEDESGCSTRRIAEILSNGDGLEKRASKLLSACMGRNGGNDNIAILLAQF